MQSRSGGGYRGWRGGRDGELPFNGYRVWDDKNVLEVDSGDGCTTLPMYLMPLNYTLYNG